MNEPQPRPSTASAAADQKIDRRRFAEAERQLAFDQLARHPEAQAEAIAGHYLSVVSLARDLGDLVVMRRMPGAPREDLDEVIAMLVRNIAEAHSSELGIALAWPAAERPPNQPGGEAGAFERFQRGDLP